METAGVLERTVTARDWATILRAYREPNHTRSVFELLITAGPFLLLWALACLALNVVGYWLSLIIMVPAAGFLVRLFMIQHDCGHGSFFRNRLINDWVGRVLGAVDAYALRFLAPQPRHSPCQLGQSRASAASATSRR